MLQAFLGLKILPFNWIRIEWSEWFKWYIHDSQIAPANRWFQWQKLIDAFHLKSLEYPYNKIGMVLHLWEPKGTFLTKFYKTGYDLWIKSSWLSTSNDPLITELVEIMDCENILQAGIELGVYFDHISGLCSNFDLGLWPSEAFYWPYYITDINRLVQ